MSDNIRTVEHATCTFCGCVCDDMDLTVDLDAKRITKAKNACMLGRAWFPEHTSKTVPFALIDGKAATTRGGGRGRRADPRRGAPADHLRPERHHLRGTAPSGGDRRLITPTSTPPPRSATVPPASRSKASAKSPATLGEIKNRADLVIYWGGNPAESIRATSPATRSPQRTVYPQRQQRPQRGLGRCAAHAERAGGGPLPPSQART